MSPPEMTAKFQSRLATVFQERFSKLESRTDQLFSALLIFQWLLGIVFAYSISPRSWSGAVSQTHVHVYAAIFLGGLLALFPALLVFRRPGRVSNRVVIAISQMLFSVLFIHLTGGRIETHFHVFGSLAFLAIYRDWRILILATLVTAADHFLRGFFWPQSVYGVLSSTPWRALEHSAWVVFEDIVLLYSLHLSRNEMLASCRAQVNLEDTVATIEEKVIERTAELNMSKQVILEQQQALTATAKLSALGEMAGGIAHEINTPLATIMLVSDQILALANDDSVDRIALTEFALQVGAISERIAKIVKGLKTFSRDGSGDAFQIFNVKQLITDALNLCQEKFKSGSVRLDVGDFDDLLCIEGRMTELSQVLLNLLSNAFDATEKLAEKWVGISVVESGDKIEIRVTDSGDGIPEHLRNRIFQPFMTTKVIGKGTGLGLGISLGIVKSHQGQLRIDTQDKNTCFLMILPKKQMSLQKSDAA